MARDGTKNLIPLNQRTKEEQKEIATMGGKASGEARKEKATMRKMLEMCLNMTNKEGMTYQQLATMGLIKGAMYGKAENYKLMLELLGELNSAEQDRQNEELSKVEELLTKLKEEASK